MAGFAAFSTYMVCDDDIKRYKACDIGLGYDFHVKYPTYRGTYLCNIMEYEIRVDEQIMKRSCRSSKRAGMTDTSLHCGI